MTKFSSLILFTVMMMMMVTLVLGTTYFCGLNSTITILEEDVVLIRLYGESCHCYVEFEGNKLDKKPTVYNEDRKDCHWSCTYKLCVPVELTTSVPLTTKKPEKPSDVTTMRPTDTTTEKPSDQTTTMKPSDQTTQKLTAKPPDLTSTKPPDLTTEQPFDHTTAEINTGTILIWGVSCTIIIILVSLFIAYHKCRSWNQPTIPDPPEAFPLLDILPSESYHSQVSSDPINISLDMTTTSVDDISPDPVANLIIQNSSPDQTHSESDAGLTEIKTPPISLHTPTVSPVLSFHTSSAQSSPVTSRTRSVNDISPDPVANLIIQNSSPDQTHSESDVGLTEINTPPLSLHTPIVSPVLSFHTSSAQSSPIASRTRINTAKRKQSFEKM